MDKEWYEPREIFFSRDQCIWIISDVLVLETGQWPVNPRGTGYTDEVDKPISHHAPFETPAQITGEMLARLECCNDCGVTLVWEVQHGLDYYELLSPTSKQALNYVSGFRRRKTDFRKWLRRKRHDKKVVFVPKPLDKHS